MKVRLHDLSCVCSGVLMYPFSVARTVLEGCADIAASAPEELTAQLGLIAGADGSPVVMIVPTWCGVRTEGESRLAPFLKLGTVLANTIDEMPYGISLTAFDPYLVTGQHEFMETCWLAAFDDDCKFREPARRIVLPSCSGGSCVRGLPQADVASHALLFDYLCQ
jgi:hypothetical protein